MNLCWFCNHQGVKNLDREMAKQVILGSVCAGHIDFQFFYHWAEGALPRIMTPRMVMDEAEKMARESLAGPVEAIEWTKRSLN